MFLNLDQRKNDYIIAVDSNDRQLHKNGLINEKTKLDKVLDKRSIVFLLCNNTVGALLAYLNCIILNCVPVMLNSKMEDDLFNRLYQTYTPKYIFLPKGRELHLVQAQLERVYEGYEYILYFTKNSIYPIHDDIQLLMTTSGTTGSPKLVKYKKGNLEANARNVAKAFDWSCDERPLCDLPMNYTMGLNVINTHIYVGATVYLTNENIMNAAYWDFIKKYKLTNMTGVPFNYEIMLKLRINKMDLPYMKTFAQGGGKLSDKVFKIYAEYAKNNGKRFIATFGTTETSARMTYLEPQFALSKIGSIGKAIPEGILSIVDNEGKTIDSPDLDGELVYSGPNVTMGYAVNKEDLNKGDEFGGVYKTGDIAKRDDEGFYYITGRKSRFIKLLGYRVSLDQSEKIVKERFGIECACVGKDDLLIIYLVDESVKNDVLQYMINVTGFFKSLFEIRCIDSIPKSDSGKIVYKLLEI